MRGRGWIAALLIAPAVLVAGVASFFLVQGLDLWNSPYTVEGTIVELIGSRDSDGDLTYSPVVEYEVDGRTYVWESSVSYGGALIPDVGDKRTLVYDPDDPADARSRSVFLLIILPLLFVAGPVIFIAVVVFFGVRTGRKVRAMAQGPTDDALARSVVGGTEIEADFMGVEPSEMDEDGNVRYRVNARAEVDGMTHRFVSHWLDEDPTVRLMELGNKVKVTFDPANPSLYEVQV